MSNPTLQSKIHLLMYCVANGVTPAGGIMFEKDILACKLDGTTQSLYVLDDLLSSIKNHTPFEDISNNTAGKNFLKSIGAYIGCYLAFQLEDNAQQIFWQDTYDIITEEKIHTDSLLWFTSLDLVVDEHYFKPINTLKEFFEYADAEKVSDTVFAFLNTTKQAIKTAKANTNQQTNALQTSQTTDLQTSQTTETQRTDATTQTNEQPATVEKTTEKTTQNTQQEVAQETAQTTNHTENAASDMAQPKNASTNNVPDLTALQQELTSQKHSLKAQQSAQAKKSLFAKLLSNPFSKTSQPQNTTANTPNPTTSSHTTSNPTGQSQTEAAQPKPHLPQEAPTLQQATDAANTSHTEAVNNTTPKTLNIDILKQLVQDKEQLDYLPSSETDIRPTLNTQPEKLAALVKLSKENHTQAMVLLAILQLNKLAKKTPFNAAFDDSSFSNADKKTLNTSTKLLETAALHGNAAAQYFLSAAYAQGIIFKKNHKKHNTWLKIAAQNGHQLAISQSIEDAKQDLASMYHEKLTDTFDDKIAMWLIGAVAFGAGILLFF